MLNDKLQKIARRFELDMFPTKPDMLSVESMLEWLSERYCIVGKDKAKELCKLTVENGDSDDFGLIERVDKPIVFYFEKGE